MISDTNISPVQEVNYLLRFTSGEALKLIDNYRKQKQPDPNWLLDSLRAELERRFGGAAAITRVLLERMDKTTGDAVDSKCTLTCNTMEGGVSSSKLLLVEVSSKKKPHAVHRVYTDRAQKPLEMRTIIALVLPPFDFQNGGRQIKIQHVIVDAVAPLSFL